MLKRMKRYILSMKKMLLKYLELKIMWIWNGLLTLGLFAYNTVCVHASISGNLKSASSTGQQEVLGWVEAVGVLGLVAAAVVWFTGNAQKAKQVLTAVLVGYILVKFAPDLWTWFIGIFG